MKIETSDSTIVRENVTSVLQNMFSQSLIKILFK